MHSEKMLWPEDNRKLPEMNISLTPGVIANSSSLMKHAGSLMSKVSTLDQKKYNSKKLVAIILSAFAADNGLETSALYLGRSLDK